MHRAIQNGWNHLMFSDWDNLSSLCPCCEKETSKTKYRKYTYPNAFIQRTNDEVSNGWMDGWMDPPTWGPVKGWKKRVCVKQDSYYSRIRSSITYDEPGSEVEPEKSPSHRSIRQIFSLSQKDNCNCSRIVIISSASNFILKIHAWWCPSSPTKCLLR